MRRHESSRPDHFPTVFPRNDTRHCSAFDVSNFLAQGCLYVSSLTGVVLQTTGDWMYFTVTTDNPSFKAAKFGVMVTTDACAKKDYDQNCPNLWRDRGSGWGEVPVSPMPLHLHSRQP